MKVWTNDIEMNESVLHVYEFFRSVADTMKITGQSLQNALAHELSHSHRETLLRMREALPELNRRVEAELLSRETCSTCNGKGRRNEYDGEGTVDVVDCNDCEVTGMKGDIR